MISNQRPEITSVEVEADERAWWDRFAGLENSYAWVQTPAMQRVLRGNYIREILRLTPKGGRILELGCGTGWLCEVLVRFGATDVCGVDFSAAQIAIAESQAKAKGLDGRVRYRCADGTQNDFEGEQFDCVIVHGFLHHLNQSEIRRTLASIPKMLKPDGRFIVFEPIRYETDSQHKQSCWEKWLWWLRQSALRGQKIGLRKIADEEARVRAELGKRDVGVYPHGPSPKEMPFAPEELESYLCPYFEIEEERRCMAIAHLATQEWMLRELSHPRSSRFLLPWIARIAARLERQLLRQTNSFSGLWIFTMLACRPHRTGLETDAE